MLSAEAGEKHMDLHYETRKGLKPDVLDRLAGFTQVSEDAWAMSLYVRASKSDIMQRSKVVQVFATTVSILAGERPLNIIFPNDAKEVKRILSKIDPKWKHLTGNITIQVPPQSRDQLVEVLEATSFTTFHAWTDGESTAISSESVLLNNLDQCHFFATFMIYDDSMEILFVSLTSGVISEVMEAVGREAGVRVISH
jgi:hypothetical protein